MIWEHCVQAPKDRVLYIHSKGSFNSHAGMNDQFRKALMYSVLHPCCLEAISSNELEGREGLDRQNRSSEDMDIGVHDVCGMRYSPIPYVAFHGNMWWARCDYIKRLIPPLQFQPAMDILKQTAYRGDPEIYIPHHRGMGRYAFEHWVASHPSLRAVDNLPFGLSSANSTFLTGYDNLPDTSAQRWKPVCSRAPRAEIPLATFLGHHFPASPLPSRQWKQYHALYKSASLSTSRRENSAPSICIWWERLGSLQQDAQQWASVLEFVKGNAGLEDFLKDWLDDYKRESIPERCQA